MARSRTQTALSAPLNWTAASENASKPFDLNEASPQPRRQSRPTCSKQTSHKESEVNAPIDQPHGLFCTITMAGDALLNNNAGPIGKATGLRSPINRQRKHASCLWTSQLRGPDAVSDSPVCAAAEPPTCIQISFHGSAHLGRVMEQVSLVSVSCVAHSVCSTWGEFDMPRLAESFTDGWSTSGMVWHTRVYMIAA